MYFLIPSHAWYMSRSPHHNWFNHPNISGEEYKSFICRTLKFSYLLMYTEAAVINIYTHKHTFSQVQIPPSVPCYEILSMYFVPTPYTVRHQFSHPHSLEYY
jgi:hypothetical protein